MERLGLHNFQQLAQQKCVCVWEVCLEQPFGTCTHPKDLEPSIVLFETECFSIFKTWA